MRSVSKGQDIKAQSENLANLDILTASVSDFCHFGHVLMKVMVITWC